MAANCYSFSRLSLPAFRVWPAGEGQGHYVMAAKLLQLQQVVLASSQDLACCGKQGLGLMAGTCYSFRKTHCSQTWE